jgi:hypothetical protein
MAENKTDVHADAEPCKEKGRERKAHAQYLMMAERRKHAVSF